MVLGIILALETTWFHNAKAQYSNNKKMPFNSEDITLEDARKLEAQELANVIIPEFREEIISKEFRPSDMDAPVPWLTQIAFYSEGKFSGISNFCTQKRILVYFEPTNSEVSIDAINPTSKAISIEYVNRFSISKTKKPLNCSKRATTQFFDIFENEAKDGLSLLRKISMAQSSKSKYLSSLTIEFIDEFPEDSNQKWRRSKYDAFKEFPMNSIYFARKLKSNDHRFGLPNAKPNEDIWQISAGVWLMYVFVDQDENIQSIRIEHSIPAPF